MQLAAVAQAASGVGRVMSGHHCSDTYIGHSCPALNRTNHVGHLSGWSNQLELASAYPTNNNEN